MGTDGTVTYELRDDVAWLGLDRPHKRNAIDDALLAALEAAVRPWQTPASTGAIRNGAGVASDLGQRKPRIEPPEWPSSS